MNWLCWHVGTVTDPKFRVIAKLAHTQTGCVIAVWAYLLELAGGTKERGSIASYDADCAEEALGFTASEIEAVIVAMRDKGMIEGDHIAKWKDRQNLTNAERAKEWRKSKAERNEQTDVREHTRPFANATDIQTDTHTDIQTKKEIEAAPPTAAPRPKACRLSDDWNPEPEDFPAEQIARELPKFRDFWKAKSGRDATKLDWQATWRNWLRRSDDFKPARNQAGSGAAAASAGPVISDHEAQWRARLSGYKPGKFWSPNWGRRPEEGNKEIPPHIIAAWQSGIGQKGEVA
jgi:hypothetical protein